MLLSVEQLRGYTIRGTDDEIGKLHDLYFDDVSWKVLFLVADTRPWLLGHFILISPVAVGHPDSKSRVLPISLTKAQVENGPSLEEHKPVSRQHAADVAKYWDWPFFAPGDPRFDLGAFEPPPPGLSEEDAAQRSSGTSDVPHDDPHLRAVRDIRGHHVHTPDGPCGHIEDWLVDVDTWTIREVVIDTRNWWPGEKVRIPCTDITSIDWNDKSVRVRLSKDVIKRHPRYSIEPE